VIVGSCPVLGGMIFPFALHRLAPQHERSLKSQMPPSVDSAASAFLRYPFNQLPGMRKIRPNRTAPGTSPR